MGGEIIQAGIIRNLQDADLVLCDVTCWNANVFFELGIRVALNKPVALVRDTHTDEIPFDNAMVSCHSYDPRMEPWVIEAEIPRLADFVEAAGRHQENALWKYFGIRRRAAELDPGNPQDAKLDLLVAQMASLRSELASLRVRPEQESFRRGTSTDPSGSPGPERPDALDVAKARKRGGHGL
jgi:hypothetical protein